MVKKVHVLVIGIAHHGGDHLADLYLFHIVGLGQTHTDHFCVSSGQKRLPGGVAFARWGLVTCPTNSLQTITGYPMRRMHSGISTQ